MPPRRIARQWMLVAKNPMHLVETNKGATTWWCVDRRCVAGDCAFVYHTGNGVICHFEIVSLISTQPFCQMYGMATASVRMLARFVPPVSASSMRADTLLRQEGFIRRSFQGKAFAFKSEDASRAIYLLAKPR